MNVLHVQPLPEQDYTLEQAAAALQREAAWFRIDTCNWPDTYPYAPEVKGAMAYTSHGLYLCFEVSEQTVLARYEDDATARCWEDSCVEFFLQPQPALSPCYFNLEFNAIGTLHMGYGENRKNRIPATEATTSKVKRLASLGRRAVGLLETPQTWSLTVFMPWDVFTAPTATAAPYKAPAKGSVMHANFYKCGDKLPVPHFLSWNPIPLPKPDFHRPEYFGKIIFD